MASAGVESTDDAEDMMNRCGKCDALIPNRQKYCALHKAEVRQETRVCVVVARQVMARDARSEEAAETHSLPLRAERQKTARGQSSSSDDAGVLCSSSGGRKMRGAGGGVRSTRRA
jgi:hypothetical protein